MGRVIPFPTLMLDVNLKKMEAKVVVVVVLAAATPIIERAPFYIVVCVYVILQLHRYYTLFLLSN